MTEPLCLHQFFEDAARRWPDRTAIDVPPSSRRHGRRTFSYAALRQQSDILASYLRPLITCEERIVIVMLPRVGEQLYVSQLAVLKAGAAFTCVDPAFPDAQIRSVVEDSRAVAILTDTAGTARVHALRVQAPAVNVVECAAQFRGPIVRAPAPGWLLPSSLAYLVYTSGTTGRPKGVMIEHRSIVNLVQGDQQTLGLTPDDRVAQSSSPAYDSSIEETWFALATGATLVVMDDETVRLGPDLVPWLRRERITMFCPPPTLLRATGCADPERELPDLRLLHPGGEALPQDVADGWAPGRRLMNDYGPTETTVTALRGTIAPGQPITIGRPVPGMQAWVLDENLEEVPPGTPGELCLGGVGLARGYHNSPELTATKFPTHPRLGRIYRTGDRATKNAAGDFFCHGRIDTQVKIRGYRIELEAIEARLAECAGIREAVCTVQGDGPRRKLAAFVVPEPGSPTPAFDELRFTLGRSLPDYMVPSLFGTLDDLPRNTSGKLNRQALPLLETHGHDRDDSPPGPDDPIAEKLAVAFSQTLDAKLRVSIHDDFFDDLGGDSLSAAVLISSLRDDPQTASLTVRDLYETRTVAGLAKRTDPRTGARAGEPARVLGDPSTDVPVDPASADNPPQSTGRAVAATIAQSLWLAIGIMLAAPLTYLLTFHLLPFLVRRLGLVLFLVLAPVLYLGGLLVYTLLTVTAAVLVKKLLVGTYRPLRAPAWGSYYVRNWMVQRGVRLVPWRLLELTEFQNVVLRALGARVGKRVHIHRGVNLTQGGWDLLEIGDDATVGQDAALHLVTLEDGHIVIGSVTLESGSTLETRAGVGANTRVEENAWLTAWSFLPAGGRVPKGERWDGVPAEPAGRSITPSAPAAGGRNLSPALHGFALVLGRIALSIFTALPLQALGLAFVWGLGADGAGVVDWLLHPGGNARIALLDTAIVMVALPLTLVFEVVALRLMGRVHPGAIGRWSPAYVRVRLKAETVESAGRWLCGTLFWPMWLRAAGMKIGRGCEISTIIDTIPELVDIGPETFFADGIHLAGPTVSRGTVTTAPVRMGTNVFLGNHAVVGCGQTIPDNVLIGVCTVADDRKIRSGTGWFGHPPFELHNRERVACDRSLTHDPSWPRYLNRVFWELLRFILPLVPLLIGLAWFALLGQAAAMVSMPVLVLGVIPLLELGALAAPALMVVAVKWLLLGRVRPGLHPLWSCWCSRWDFLYVVWDFCGTASLTALEGTLLLNGYLRAMGVRIGRGVLLGPGFVHVADPDMLNIEAGATVSSLNQAHTFEDRVLKMDYVNVRRGATVGNGALLLYGADLGDGSHVTPNSVVMKRERLLPSRTYTGRPTHLVPRRERNGHHPTAGRPATDPSRPQQFVSARFS